MPFDDFMQTVFFTEKSKKNLKYITELRLVTE